MLEAAVEGAQEASRNDPPRVVAVTVLTSLDGPALDELGIRQSPHDVVLTWARLATESALAGVVASAQEAASIRRACGNELLIVTPGIRPDASDRDDQRRVLTPAQAIQAGSNILVVGRPVTRAADQAAEDPAHEPDHIRPCPCGLFAPEPFWHKNPRGSPIIPFPDLGRFRSPIVPRLTRRFR